VYRSHDRALPEIPASASGVASTDDDDEEDEGHYDVISKSRRAAAGAANVPSNCRTTKPRFCHPYEVVAGDLDSTYAGIREELEAAISSRNSGGRANNSHVAAAAANGISDPLYAGITDDGRTRTSPPVVALRSGITSAYSTVVNNAQVLRLHVSDQVVEPERPVSVGVRDGGDADSPFLPPRNGNIDTVDGGVLSAAAACAVSSAWLTSTAMSSLSTNAATCGPNVLSTSAEHADPAVHIQELQLLHNSANDDAMPVSGRLFLYCHQIKSVDLLRRLTTKALGRQT